MPEVTLVSADSTISPLKSDIQGVRPRGPHTSVNDDEQGIRQLSPPRGWQRGARDHERDREEVVPLLEVMIDEAGELKAHHW